MKTKSIIFVLFGAFGFSLPGNSQGISGSAHDFSGLTWAAGAENSKCGVCHAVHNAKAVTSAPLWNHKTTAVASYTMYSSSTMNAAAPTSLGASSKLCLSCHDGTVALESFGSVTTGSNTISAANKIGGTGGSDLSHEHPVSILYNTALATLDGGLKDPSTAAALSGTISNKMLFSDFMECASCHDVHRKISATHLLRIENSGSSLCLTCHNK
jgi:predicted CXXCH cytochrome family protein